MKPLATRPAKRRAPPGRRRRAKRDARRAGRERSAAGIVLAALLALACAGCEYAGDHMAHQPRADIGDTSPVFGGDVAERLPPAGSVARARGDAAAVSSGRAVAIADTADDAHEALRGDGRTGAPPRNVSSSSPPLSPPTPTPTPASPATLARGAQRYAIYCLPCHGALGAGDGAVVQRGFPAPPPLDDPALRDASDARLHDAIRRGFGRMAPFADRVDEADTRAVIAYVRELQRHADAAGASR